MKLEKAIAQNIGKLIHNSEGKQIVLSEQGYLLSDVIYPFEKSIAVSATISLQDLQDDTWQNKDGIEIVNRDEAIQVLYNNKFISAKGTDSWFSKASIKTYREFYFSSLLIAPKNSESEIKNG